MLIMQSSFKISTNCHGSFKKIYSIFFIQVKIGMKKNFLIFFSIKFARKELLEKYIKECLFWGFPSNFFNQAIEKLDSSLNMNDYFGLS